jgi:hypothetical protein
VLDLKDVELLAKVSRDRHSLQKKQGERDRQDHPGDEHESAVVQPDQFTVGVALRCESGGPEQAETDDPGGEQLNQADTEVAQAGLQAERCAGEALGKEIAGRGHESREATAADARGKREREQHPIRG